VTLCYNSGATQVGNQRPSRCQPSYTVNVTGVTAGSTNVTVLAGGSPIGQANNPAGFAAGQVAVTTSALVKDSQITATQTKNGCTSAAAGSGPVVGGGANPKLSAFLSCFKNSTNAGPSAPTAPHPPPDSHTFLKPIASKPVSAPPSHGHRNYPGPMLATPDLLQNGG